MKRLINISAIFLTLVWIFFFPVSALAQFGADFTVNSEIGCAPFIVKVFDQSGAPSDVAVNLEYGDGSPLDTTRNGTHEYTQPGTYTIIQTVANGNPVTFEREITVIDPQNPDYFIIPCKGTAVYVQLQDDFYPAYYIDWGDGSNEIVSQQSLNYHDYGSPGAYNITVQGLINGAQTEIDSSNVNCSVNTKSVTLINALVPGEIGDIEVIDQNSIQLNYSLDPFTPYLLEMSSSNNPGIFNVIDTIDFEESPTGQIISGLDTETQFYCFRVTAFDACDNETIPSNEFCSINLSASAEVDGSNVLTWHTNTSDFTSFRINRNGSDILNSLDASLVQYTDTAINCGVEYCYFVELTSSSGLISRSATQCVTAIFEDTPPGIQNISASVNGMNIELQWPEPQNVAVDRYQISRTSQNQPVATTGVSEVNIYNDGPVRTNEVVYSYRVNYLDECQNRSEGSIRAQQILLRVSQQDQSLYWNRYAGWQNGVAEYEIDQFDLEGNLLGTQSAGLDTLYLEDFETLQNQRVRYRIRALPSDGTLPEVVSNFVELIFQPKLTCPNAINPNSAIPENQRFRCFSRFIATVDIRIYNRWGQIVYQSNDPQEGWDGTLSGKPLPGGTYVYYYGFTDQLNRTFSVNGEIVLIR